MKVEAQHLVPSLFHMKMKSGALAGASVMPKLILNLGCGIRTNGNCINIDWSWWLKTAVNPVMRAAAPLFLDRGRLDRLKQLAAHPVLVHDLRKGIPCPDRSVDAVYHSHVIEHIDRPFVGGFMQEIRRVLKPGGVHRIAAPDLERLAKAYLADLTSECPMMSWQEHDTRVAAMYEQSVRRESGAIKDLKSAFRRKLDMLVRGDARKRGETHQWMYDRINLSGLLVENGFREIRVVDYHTSRIPDWDSIALDTGSDGQEYKPESIYVECIK
jgi:SAM-dependent methyltransferase